MGMCFIPDCKHYSQRDLCKFFRFPLDETVRKKWIKNIRRDDRSPNKYSKVCSCHFKDGNKKELPTIFERNKNKIFMFESFEKLKSKGSNKNQDILPPAAIDGNESEDEENRALLDLGNIPSVLNEDVETLNAASELNIAPTNTVCNTPALDSHFSNLTVISSCDENINNVCSGKMDAISSFEKYMLEKENEELKAKIKDLEKHPFSYRLIAKNNKLVNYYTGIPSSNLFSTILDICLKNDIKYYAGWNAEGISTEDQLLMTLMKLRQNYGHIDLSTRFGVSLGTVSNVILTWIHVLHEIFFVNVMDTIPSVDKNRMCLPSCFANFANCRVVLDCTELNINVPKRMDHQRMFYSNYKHRNTMKVLIAIAPNGVITYVSDLYPGSVSDKDIFRNCDAVHHQLKPGDLILADKGFLITDLVPVGVNINIPPFLFSPQFTPAEVIETRNIARARIHVERAIRRIKVFHVTKCIPKVYFKFATIIFQVCTALTNFENPLIQEVKSLYYSSA